MDDIKRSYEVLRALKRINELIKQNAECEFKRLNLTGPQGMLIGILTKFGEMKISDLSEKMGISSSTVSGIIDRLEIQGYVERSRSEEDRRVVIVNLTKDFRKESKVIFRSIHEHMTKIMSSASDEELEKILTGIRTLEQLINRINNDKKE